MIPRSGERYTLSADRLEGTRVQLNGTALALGANDDLPSLAGVKAAAGAITLSPTTITFLALGEAGNSSCR